VVQHDAGSGVTAVDTADGTVPLDEETAAAVLPIDEPAARLLAGVARQTPREALALFRSARDVAADAGRRTIDEVTARQTLERQGIDEEGLRPEEREYLGAVAAGPLSKSTLAARLGVSVRTLLHAIEPHLLRRRLVEITRRGRVPARQ
jgi:Holliday junction DNA helicase RuvB